MPRRSCCARLVLLAALLVLQLCPAEKTEVTTCAELVAAVADPSVHHVLVLPAADGGGYNCTEADMPPNSVEVEGREVVVEGQGPGVYLDMNKLSDVVFVGEGGRVELKNLWMDDCMYSEPPVLCFVRVLEGGWIALTDMQVSDAACLAVAQSKGIGFFMYTMRYATPKEVGQDTSVNDYEPYDKHEYLEDPRALIVRNTGWMLGIPVGVNYRVTNTTFTCTGNITHDLRDGEFVFLDVERRSPLHYGLVLSGSILVLLMAAGLAWFAWRRARDSHLPEYQIAASRGYLLEGPLGSGHFGRVYKARSKATGQLVAVKVIDLLPSQRRQMASAWRECQLMSRVQHDCIVRVITFYTAQVQQRQHIIEPTPGEQYVEIGYNVQSIVGAGSGTPPMPAAHHGGARGGGRRQQPQQPVNNSSSGSSGGSGSLGSEFFGNGSSNTSSSDGLDGAVSIQVQLVIQYCDMGTLDDAIKRGVFEDASSGTKKLRDILATVLEMAHGLAYLHHPDRRMVHRDLSAANVLLVTHTNKRGFRALLSDFGLSTSLAAGATHKTSEVKGTISYMSPELFMHDDVSPALDVYSLGIIMYMMYMGRDPYDKQTPAMIILSKVRSLDQPSKARLPALEDCPEAFQQLLWDCTHCSRQSRPTAADVVRRVEAMLLRTP